VKCSGQPRAGLGADQIATPHMRGGRGEFGNERVAFSGEEFRLGDVGQGIKVEQVGGEPCAS